MIFRARRVIFFSFLGVEMYEVKVKKSFSGAHKLRGYRGKCEELHGHNWLVEVTVRAGDLDDIDIALDFAELKVGLREVLAVLDHKYLNDVPPFDKVNPTSERLAGYVFEQMGKRINDDRVKVARVDVWETEENRASYFLE